jgi:hypothetical protein
MQSEKIKLLSQYIICHNENPFIMPFNSNQKTEIKLILKKVTESCSNFFEFCCGTDRIAPRLTSEKREFFTLDRSHDFFMRINNLYIFSACFIAQAAPIKGDWA